MLVVAGWFLADLIYRQGSTAFDWISQLWGGALYRTVSNKYYIDEAYAAGPVAGTLEVSRGAAWFDFHIVDWIVNFAATLTVFSAWFSGLIDRYVVDGLVNLASNITLEVGGRMRRLQTGFDQRLSVRNSRGGYVRPHRPRSAAHVRLARGGAAGLMAATRNRQ